MPTVVSLARGYSTEAVDVHLQAVLMTAREALLNLREPSRLRRRKES